MKRGRILGLSLLLLVGGELGCDPRGPVVIDSLATPVLDTKISAPVRPAPLVRRVMPRAKPPASPAGWIPRGGISKRWKYIVVHHSATPTGGARKFDKMHRAKGWDELGYHFVIGNGTDTPDGYIEVGGRWRKQKHGAHCKVPGNAYNEHGIGICLVGNFEHHRPSSKQMASLAKLTAFLAREARISPANINTHGGITGKTACPGRYFSLSDLKTRVSREVVASSR